MKAITKWIPNAEYTIDLLGRLKAKSWQLATLGKPDIVNPSCKLWLEDGRHTFACVWVYPYIDYSFMDKGLYDILDDMDTKYARENNFRFW